MFGQTPNLEHQFGPSVGEMATDVGNGKNMFGMDINSSVANCGGFANPLPSMADKIIKNLTYIDIRQLVWYYTVWYSQRTITGLDLNNQPVTNTMLWWLEYWYNSLIDNTLGYSYNTEYLVGNFIQNYELPEGVEVNQANLIAYYPTEEEIATGHWVFFDDVAHPHYSDYHKVGRVKKGLLKAAQVYVISKFWAESLRWLKHSVGIIMALILLRNIHATALALQNLLHSE